MWTIGDARDPNNHEKVFANQSGNAHFSLVTGGYWGVTEQFLGLSKALAADSEWLTSTLETLANWLGNTHFFL